MSYLRVGPLLPLVALWGRRRLSRGRWWGNVTSLNTRSFHSRRWWRWWRNASCRRRLRFLARGRGRGRLNISRLRWLRLLRGRRRRGRLNISRLRWLRLLRGRRRRGRMNISRLSWLRLLRWGRRRSMNSSLFHRRWKRQRSLRWLRRVFSRHGHGHGYKKSRCKRGELHFACMFRSLVVESRVVCLVKY
ncbi:hypothetical protein F5Y06DRAFT_260469 [Hypoxylon sp. FL0890]|nr:hypothetical protein F5Y06DRAFT_260469 [Hypoxylon sp. FL0890]